MSKQALLYHFDRKEALYAAVIDQITEWLFQHIPGRQQEGYSPALQLEHTFLRLHRLAMENPAEMRLLMREMLDNSTRAHTVQSWPIKRFFDGLVATVKTNACLENTSHPLIFTFIFQVLSAIMCFAVSRPALRQMYGNETYLIARDHYSIELQNHIRWFLAASSEEQRNNNLPI